MGKFDGYLICTDLDGTFTNGHDICGENAEYVKYFQENGGLFTVSTGRLPNHIEAFSDFAPNCPVVTHNGAAVYDMQEKMFLYKSIITEDASEVLDCAFKSDCIRKVWINTALNGYDIKGANDIKKDDPPFKIVICAEPAEEALKLKNELAEKFGDKFCIFLAWRTGIEILARNTNKGTAVARLRSILGDKVKKVICVGDSESDTFMFDFADIGIAVENADEYAKKSADRITVNFVKGFVKYVVEDIEKGIL